MFSLPQKHSKKSTKINLKKASKITPKRSQKKASNSKTFFKVKIKNEFTIQIKKSEAKTPGQNH